MFRLEVKWPQMPIWHPIAEFMYFDNASVACDRAILSEKCDARIVRVDENATLEDLNSSVIMHKRYDPRLDPENWRDEYEEKDEPEETDEPWTKSGF